MANNQENTSSSTIKDLLMSLVINVGIPLLIIYLLTTYTGMSTFLALSIASVVPLASSVIGLVRNRRLDLIAIFFLLGVLTNIAALLLGGNVRLLLIRESFFTGALGLACFVSLLLPRPLMFYVGRQMLAGNDPVKLERFNAGWQNLYACKVHRLISIVWACTLVGEFLIRVIIANTLPTTLAFGLGSTIFTIILALTFAWTFAYIRYATRHALARDIILY